MISLLFVDVDPKNEFQAEEFRSRIMIRIYEELKRFILHARSLKFKFEALKIVYFLN